MNSRSLSGVVSECSRNAEASKCRNINYILLIEKTMLENLVIFVLKRYLA